jgi:hypothetical protein
MKTLNSYRLLLLTLLLTITMGLACPNMAFQSTLQTTPPAICRENTKRERKGGTEDKSPQKSRQDEKKEKMDAFGEYTEGAIFSLTCSQGTGGPRVVGMHARGSDRLS